MFKINNRNTGKSCEICSKLTVKTFFTPFSTVSIVDFEQVNVIWDISISFYLKKISFNSFLINFPILHPLKTPKSFWVSGVFRCSYQIATLARNELTISFIGHEHLHCSGPWYDLETSVGGTKHKQLIFGSFSA